MLINNQNGFPSFHQTHAPLAIRYSTHAIYHIFNRYHALLLVIVDRASKRFSKARNCSARHRHSKSLPTTADHETDAAASFGTPVTVAVAGRRVQSMSARSGNLLMWKCGIVRPMDSCGMPVRTQRRDDRDTHA